MDGAEKQMIAVRRLLEEQADLLLSMSNDLQILKAEQRRSGQTVTRLKLMANQAKKAGAQRDSALADISRLLESLSASKER